MSSSLTFFRSLRQRSFAILWSGQTISRLGDALYRIALAWWVAEKTGSPEAMGTVMIFTSAPMLLFLFIGGVTGDRLPRIRVMLVSDSIRGLISLTVALFVLTQALDLWHIYVASIIFGFVDAFFQPAYTATLPDITSSENLPSANSLTTLSGQVASVIGPALYPLLVGIGGVALVFACDGLSFFIAAACLLMIPSIPVRRAFGNQPTSFFQDVREGISVVTGTPWLWFTMMIVALGNATLIAPFAVTTPFLVKDNLRAGADTFALIVTAAGIGSAIAAIWVGRWTALRRRGPVVYSAVIASSLAILSIGLPIGIPGIAVATFVLGAGMVTFNLIWMNTLQELVPRDLLGRVASLDCLGSYVLLPLGYGIAGWATYRIGAPLVFIIGGAVTLALAMIGFFYPAIRNLD